MAKIGTFKKVSGELRGEIATLTIKAKSVRIVPEAEVTGNNPTHRVFVGDVEIGAGWPKRTNDERPFLSLKLDDPSFVGPIYAQLWDGDDGDFNLTWTRPVRRD